MFRKKKDNLARSNSGSELVANASGSNSPTSVNTPNDSAFSNQNSNSNNNNNDSEQQQEFTIGYYGSSHIFASQQTNGAAPGTPSGSAGTASSQSYSSAANGFLGTEDFGNYLIPKALQDLYTKQTKDSNLIAPSQPNIDPFEDEFFQNSGKLHDNEETLDASYQSANVASNTNDQELIMEIRKKKQSEKENIKLKDNQKVEKEGWLIKEGKTVRSWKRRWFILSKETLSYYTARKNKFKGIINLGDYDIQMSKDRIDNRQCMELVLRNPSAVSFTAGGASLSRENSEGIMTTPTQTDTSRDSIDLSQMGDEKRSENGEPLGRTFFIDAETLLDKAEWFTAIENKVSFLKYLRKCTARREPVDIAMVELFEKSNNSVFDLSRDLFVGNEELMEVTMDGLEEQLKQNRIKQEEALKKRAATVIAKKEEEETSTATPQPQQGKEDSKEDKEETADSTATSAKVKQLKKYQGKPIDPKNYALTIDAVIALKDPIRNNLALKKLILKGCRIGNEGLQHLCEALLGVSSTTRISNPNYSGSPTTQLTEIDLSGCALVGMSEGLQTFVTVLNEIKSIEVINLSYNMLDDSCVELLCKPALENTISVKRLSLHYNAISDKGCAVLVNTLIHNKYLSIQELELSHNLIRDDGAKAIAKLMEEQQQQPPSSTKCHSFHLGYNSIGNEGVKAIASALEKNSYVMSLNLESNEITYKGIKDLAFMMVKNTKIHTLNLGGNKLGEQGLALLANTGLEFAEFELKSDA